MNIAIIRLSALGDIIQSSIVLQFIKKYYPNSNIDWFIDDSFEDLLKDHLYIDRLYSLPLKKKKIIKTLKILLNARKNNYDLIIDLQGLIKSAIVARILSKNTYGFDKNSLKENLASYFYKYKISIDYNENIIIRNIKLLNFALKLDIKKNEIINKKPCFIVDEKIKYNILNKITLADKNILIHMGSSMENKNYPKEKLISLCKMILANYSKTHIFLVWGNDKEKNKANIILDNLKNNRVFISPKINIKELIALTYLSDLVIGNDSGPTHLAFAINKPSITIFGATPSYRNAFDTNINKTIDSGKYISDCKHIDKNDFCIKNIDEMQIFNLIKGLL